LETKPWSEKKSFAELPLMRCHCLRCAALPLPLLPPLLPSPPLPLPMPLPLPLPLRCCRRRRRRSRCTAAATSATVFCCLIVVFRSPSRPIWRHYMSSQAPSQQRWTALCLLDALSIQLSEVVVVQRVQPTKREVVAVVAWRGRSGYVQSLLTRCITV